MVKKGKSVSPKKGFVFDENLSTEKLTLRCIGGELFDVALIWCFESVFIRRELTLYSDRKTPIRVKIPIHILPLVDYFCVTRWDIVKDHHHDDNLLLNYLERFGFYFVHDVPTRILLQVMDAAYELRIKSLLDLTRNAIVERVGPKLAKKILTEKGKSVWSNKATLRFSCLDGKIAHVDPRCCYESGRILHVLRDTEKAENENWLKVQWNVVEGDIGRFATLSQIPSHILSMVNDFCISRLDVVEAYGHDYSLLSEMLEVFDCSFAQKHPLTLLVQLMLAAYEMRIKSLLELTRNAIVDRLDGKSAEEIRTIFNMPDFTHEAWVKPHAFDTWAHKEMMGV